MVSWVRIQALAPRMTVKAIRALDRGLDVLRIIQELKAASLNDLHLATRLSKATLLRILKTLISRDLVWQRIADGAYVPSYTFSKRARVFDEETHLAEVAAPILADLCKRVRWPSALLSPRLDHMVTIESNRPMSDFDYIVAPRSRWLIQREHVALGLGALLPRVLFAEGTSCDSRAFAEEWPSRRCAGARPGQARQATRRRPCARLRHA